MLYSTIIFFHSFMQLENSPIKYGNLGKFIRVKNRLTWTKVTNINSFSACQYVIIMSRTRFRVNLHSIVA